MSQTQAPTAPCGGSAALFSVEASVGTVDRPYEARMHSPDQRLVPGTNELYPRNLFDTVGKRMSASGPDRVPHWVPRAEKTTLTGTGLAMASAEQLKALLRSHMEGDDDHFYSVAMQVAAREARRGHGKLAEQLRSLIDESKGKRGLRSPLQIGRPHGELTSILEAHHPKNRLKSIVVPAQLGTQIERIIREQHHADRILDRGLTLRRKLLLLGPPGTGKTLTASILAGELGLPLLSVRLDGLITKYMGETAAKLRQIFESTNRTLGVYFFDEFDAIGSRRGMANEVGEMRRILNSFLQMIEQDGSRSLVLAASNHPELLDPALFRRFDDILQYGLPDQPQIEEVLRTRLAHKVVNEIDWQNLAMLAQGLSHAEVTRAANEVLKDALMDRRGQIRRADIERMLIERKEIAKQISDLGQPQE